MRGVRVGLIFAAGMLSSGWLGPALAATITAEQINALTAKAQANMQMSESAGSQALDGQSMEADIAAMDESTRQTMARAMIQKLEVEKTGGTALLTPSGSPGALRNFPQQETDGWPRPSISRFAGEKPDGRQQSANGEFQQAADGQYALSPADNISAKRKTGCSEKGIAGLPVRIPRLKEDYLLINVGDVVFFLTPKARAISPNDRYLLYKATPTADKDQPAGVWLEQVGKVKILQSNPEISIGRLIAAHDIIQNGDMMYLCTQP